MQHLTSESVYQQVLQGEWADLDPRLRTYFGPTSPGSIGVGRGTYDTAGSRIRLLRPVFAVTARSQILFPEVGSDVPFTVVNAPQPDGTLTASRTFAFPHRMRVMRDTLRVIDGRLVERIGKGGLLEMTLDVLVDRGGMRLVSRGMSLRLGSLTVPLPPFAQVTVEERADGDRQYVDVRVRSRLVGEIFRYAGTFTYEHVVRGAMDGGI